MRRECLAAAGNPSSEPQGGKHRVRMSLKRLKTCTGPGDGGGAHPEQAEREESLRWRAACADPHRGAKE